MVKKWSHRDSPKHPRSGTTKKNTEARVTGEHPKIPSIPKADRRESQPGAEICGLSFRTENPGIRPASLYRSRRRIGGPLQMGRDSLADDSPVRLRTNGVEVAHGELPQ